MANYRNPNGYGSVVRLSGNRRRPFMVCKTSGYDDRGYPIRDIIGYYSSRTDAMIALAKYNEDPYDVDMSKLTMKEVYELWHKEAKLKASMERSLSAAFGHCKSVHGRQYKTLRRGHMQVCIDNCGKGYSTRTNIKLLFSKLDKYAYDHDIIAKCYAELLDVGEKETSTKHGIISDEEVAALWTHEGEKFVDETLFMLYSGCRISEMLQMRCANIDLDDNVMIGGVKTAAGKNRTIPIHSMILDLVKRHYNEENTYLFPIGGDPIELQQKYAREWRQAMLSIGFDHFTHDCRHTLISKLDSAGANKVAVDRIVGHASKSVGEQVYTHKTIKELHEALEMLSYVAPTK